MVLVRLNKKNILDYKDIISNFFKNNEEAWEFFHPHKPTWETLNSIIKSSEKDYYGLYVYQGSILGYGMLRGWDDGYDIPSLGIIMDRNQRGRGLGKNLMNELHKVAFEFGAEKVRLTVLKENLSAIKLYKSLGYDMNELDENNLIGFKTL